MSEIQRYHLTAAGFIEKFGEGDIVTFSDHLADKAAAVAKAVKEAVENVRREEVGPLLAACAGVTDAITAVHTAQNKKEGEEQIAPPEPNSPFVQTMGKILRSTKEKNNGPVKVVCTKAHICKSQKCLHLVPHVKHDTCGIACGICEPPTCEQIGTSSKFTSAYTGKE